MIKHKYLLGAALLAALAGAQAADDHAPHWAYQGKSSPCTSG